MNSKIYLLRNIFFVLSFICATIFIVQTLTRAESQSADSYGNIVFTLDVSQSMQVRDVGNTSRLDAAKQYIYDMISGKSGYHFGLTIFAGASQRVLPLTQDRELFATFVSGLNHKNITKQGTNISAALEDALANFSDTTGGAIILVTDGDEEDIEVSPALQKAFQQSQVAFFVLGVGSERGGYIPSGDMFQPYIMYRGERVVAQLNTDGLESLARELSGEYLAYPETPDLSQKNIQEKNRHSQHNYFFLYLGCILWILCLAMIVVEKYFYNSLREYVQK